MKISAAAWHKHINALSKINRTAGEKMRQFLDSEALNYSDPKDIEYMVKYAYGLSEKYGEAVAELSCQMYDMMARSQKAGVPAAEPAETATYAETEAAIRGSLKHSPSGQEITGTVERLVKQAGADTKLKNAKRDGAYFAWVPSGDTCPYCMALAALGWQKAGKKTIKGTHAEHIHKHCDCEYAIDFSGDLEMEGYDPDAIREQIRDMTGLEDTDDLIRLAGRGGNGRDYDYINTMRRQQYAKNKDVINAQKRAAYIKRRLVPGFSEIIGEGEREYSREEIIEIAKETKQVADKHIPGIESRWSGQIEIEEKKTPGKLWNCDIRTPSRTSPHALLHEQIHAKSISLYGEKMGRKYI